MMNGMEDLRPRIARTLRREREAAGLSVSELARRAGISKATVSQLENGAGNPSVETLWALGVALGVPFAVLVDQQASAPTLIRASTTPASPRRPRRTARRCSRPLPPAHGATCT